MDQPFYKWAEIDADRPIPLLQRQTVRGEQMLVAMIHLEKGCKVQLHHHQSEQFAYVISGRMKWGMGAPGTPERREFESGAGSVLHFRSNVPHEAEALEDTQILDMLSPPAAMGVDAQARGSH